MGENGNTPSTPCSVLCFRNISGGLSSKSFSHPATICKRNHTETFTVEAPA